MFFKAVGATPPTSIRAYNALKLFDSNFNSGQAEAVSMTLPARISSLKLPYVTKLLEGAGGAEVAVIIEIVIPLLLTQSSRSAAKPIQDSELLALESELAPIAYLLQEPPILSLASEDVRVVDYAVVMARVERIRVYVRQRRSVRFDKTPGDGASSASMSSSSSVQAYSKALYLIMPTLEGLRDLPNNHEGLVRTVKVASRTQNMGVFLAMAEIPKASVLGAFRMLGKLIPAASSFMSQHVAEELMKKMPEDLSSSLLQRLVSLFSGKVSVEILKKYIEE